MITIIIISCLLLCSISVLPSTIKVSKEVLLTIHLQNMCLVEVLVAVSMATVLPHVDGGHLGDVQGAVVSKIL